MVDPVSLIHFSYIVNPHARPLYMFENNIHVIKHCVMVYTEEFT